MFGQLRNLVVSHGLFLKIQGGQAVFIGFGKFCDEKYAEDVLTKVVKINKIY